MSEISNIKAEIARLEARLSALESKPAEIKPRYEEEGVRISSFVERGAFEMCTREEGRKLLDIVQRRYSALRLVDITERDREIELDYFMAAFFYLGHTDRRADGTLDTRGYPSWYCDAARDWLRRYCGKFGDDLNPKTFTAAALAHADIAVGSADDFRSGYGFGVAIIPIGSGGKKCSNAWKKLLDGTLRVREPERVPVPDERPSPVRVSYNNN